MSLENHKKLIFVEPKDLILICVTSDCLLLHISVRYILIFSFIWACVSQMVSLCEAFLGISSLFSSKRFEIYVCFKFSWLILVASWKLNCNPSYVTWCRSYMPPPLLFHMLCKLRVFVLNLRSETNSETSAFMSLMWFGLCRGGNLFWPTDWALNIYGSLNHLYFACYIL
jgi:hypothetical protein